MDGNPDDQQEVCLLFFLPKSEKKTPLLVGSGEGDESTEISLRLRFARGLFLRREVERVLSLRRERFPE